MMAVRVLVLCVVTILFGCAVRSSPAGEPDVNKGGAADTQSLEVLERRIQAAVKKVTQSVVAVETENIRMNQGHYQAFASGVIISADGLILSQYHVTHMTSEIDPQQSHKAGRKLKVILHDGTPCEAELLGAVRGLDLSLVRMTKPGPYPFAPLDAKVAVALGDGVLKLGHPMGYRRDRPPVVRFGRVLYADADSAISDCRVVGGDSGGPYFDLEGRLVGIMYATGVSKEGLEKRLVPRTDMLTASVSNAVIADRVASMLKGEILDAKLAKFDSRKPILAAEKWSQGSEARSAFRETVAPAWDGVVALMDGGERVGLGTVVGEGLVLTKASILPKDPKCRLRDGTVVAAEVLGADPGFDLALLKVKANGLRPVVWSDEVTVPLGSLLAAPGPDDLLAVGVVSVSRRDLVGPFPTKLDPPRKAPAEAPAVLGSVVRGRGYWVEHVEGRAAAAGVQVGDVILSVAETPLRDHADLAACVRGHWAGEQVAVCVIRASKPLWDC
jgi:serine protease Do